MRALVLIQVFMVLTLAACAGMKVINPNEQNQNEGTLALDLSEGTPKLVATYTCNLKSMGTRFAGFGKTEEEARQDVIGKCQSRTTLSFCKPEEITCVKN